MSVSALETYQSIGLPTTEDKEKKLPGGKQELGQEEFLKLMTAQLTHQDPNKPMENGDFLGQMAQFSTVTGIDELNKSFSEFASSLSSGQSLQAATLVGQSVLVPSDEAYLSLTDKLSGEIKLNDTTTDLRVSFVDSFGETVKTIELGTQEAGDIPFEWDGELSDGGYADSGLYSIRAEATINNKNTVLQTFVNGNVESVELGKEKDGIQLALVGLGNKNFNDVKKIF